MYRLSGVTLAVFVDGPVHEYANIKERDRQAEQRLDNQGWEVVRFPYDADWDAIVAETPAISAPLPDDHHRARRREGLLTTTTDYTPVPWSRSATANGSCCPRAPRTC